MTNSAQSYMDIAEALLAAGVSPDAAEFHGGLCGSLCGGGIEAARAWIAAWMKPGDATPQHVFEAPDILRRLELRTWEAFHSAELQLQPLLPDDDTPLAERVDALAGWCQGFLAGLGLSGFEQSRDEQQRSESAEIIEDFVEISRATVGDDTNESSTEGDFQLAELVEYVRVGAQLLFEGFEARRAEANTRSLHRGEHALEE
jgi:uncharacterized protein YgfB (UPF0149 family)